jgi:hypothetical protein
MQVTLLRDRLCGAKMDLAGSKWFLSEYPPRHFPNGLLILTLTSR